MIVKQGPIRLKLGTNYILQVFTAALLPRRQSNADLLTLLLPYYFLAALAFTEWAVWSVCSHTCTSDDEPANHVSRRECKDQENPCKGELKMAKACDVGHCPGKGPSLNCGQF